MTAQAIIHIATHDGPFHADDVLAVAILTTLYPRHKVLRTRDMSLIASADFVVDVGGLYDHRTRRYDHHMRHPPHDNFGHIFSSAGLIWRHYHKAYLQKIGIPKSYRYKETTLDLIPQVDKVMRTRWIYPIDRNDNGVANGPTPIAEVVAALAPILGEKRRERYDTAFLEAVSMTTHLFKRACFHAVDYAINRHEYLLGEKEILADGKIFVASTEMRRFGNFAGEAAHFVVFPAVDHNDDGREYYIVRPIYESNSKLYKTPIPEDILGLNRDALQTVGYLGVNFVHHSGFMIRTDSKEAAIAFCHRLLAESAH